VIIEGNREKFKSKDHFGKGLSHASCFSHFRHGNGMRFITRRATGGIWQQDSEEDSGQFVYGFPEERS
jgi:hypothetical protein